MESAKRAAIQIWWAVLRGIGLGALLSLAFAGGFLLRGEVDPRTVLGDCDYPLLSEAQALLDRYFIRPLPERTQLEYGAIRGMLETLNDPFTIFIEPVVAQNESDVLAGTYGGIGVQVQRDGEGNFVLYPFPDSPALEAGIRDGDILVAVNGEEITHAHSMDVVERMLRGEVGDTVTVTVRHIDDRQEETFEIEFAQIEVPSVIWAVRPENPELGYVHVLRFTHRTPDEMREALSDLRGRGISALILDLRDNPGGLLQEAVDIADEFLDSGVVLYELRRGEDEVTYEAEPGGSATDIPMVVLVNNGTASGAEVVAGALQGNGRAILIGQTTYGKGSVQLILQLSDGSSLHVTNAEWFTPDHSTLNGEGLQPDVPMIPAAEFDAELNEAIRYLSELIEVQAEAG